MIIKNDCTDIVINDQPPLPLCYCLCWVTLTEVFDSVIFSSFQKFHGIHVAQVGVAVADPGAFAKKSIIGSTVKAKLMLLKLLVAEGNVL